VRKRKREKGRKRKVGEEGNERKKKKKENFGFRFSSPLHVSDGLGQPRWILRVLDDNRDPRQSTDIFTHKNLRILVVMGGR